MGHVSKVEKQTEERFTCSCTKKQISANIDVTFKVLFWEALGEMNVRCGPGVAWASITKLRKSEKST